MTDDERYECTDCRFNAALQSIATEHEERTGHTMKAVGPAPTIPDDDEYYYDRWNVS